MGDAGCAGGSSATAAGRCGQQCARIYQPPVRTGSTRSSVLGGPALPVKSLEDFGRLRGGPVALLRQLDHPQRTILAGEHRLRDRNRRLRPREGTWHAPLVGRLSEFADYDQPAGPDDASLAGFVGPVGTGRLQPDLSRREKGSVREGRRSPATARQPWRLRAGHPVASPRRSTSPRSRLGCPESEPRDRHRYRSAQLRRSRPPARMKCSSAERFSTSGIFSTLSVE